MNRSLRNLLLGALSVAVTGASAQVPQLLNYQGRVAVAGTNFEGTAQFKFALVDATGSVNFWSNDGKTSGQPGAAVPLIVTKGLYAVLLGDTSLSGMTVSITPTVFTNSDVRLRVWFNDGATGFQQLAPDQRIAAVGYALVAASLDPSSDVRGQRLGIGSGQKLSGTGSTIAGGAANVITNDYAVVSGGRTNTAGGLASVVGGGEINSASATMAVVGGGYGNLASGIESVVGGGELNGASGIIATVGGGYGNLATGYAATIPGGYANLAGGAYSFAAGAGAVTTNTGTFVWADASSTNALVSTTDNEFMARAAGGVRLFANANATVGVRLAPGANAWSAASDRHLKENFKPVDTRAVLARLIATPVTEWNLVSQPASVRHIGPMAQDFQASFGVGEDDRHISSTDADGVAFAAIQGLHELVKEKDARIAGLEQRLIGLEEKLRRCDALLDRIQAAVPEGR